LGRQRRGRATAFGSSKLAVVALVHLAIPLHLGLTRYSVAAATGGATGVGVFGANGRRPPPPRASPSTHQPQPRLLRAAHGRGAVLPGTNAQSRVINASRLSQSSRPRHISPSHPKIPPCPLHQWLQVPPPPLLPPSVYSTQFMPLLASHVISSS
jgi:hypothetical protein